MTPKFQVGQRVRVVRKVPADAFYADLTGLEGVIQETDVIGYWYYGQYRIIQVNYTIESHYLHEQELELVPDSPYE